jgi:hypothetical protein
MGLVAIPEREPGTKISFQIRNRLNSLDQSSIQSLLAILLEVRKRLGSLKIKGRVSTGAYMILKRLSLSLPPSLSQKVHPQSSSPSSFPW